MFLINKFFWKGKNYNCNDNVCDGDDDDNDD
jgi:hypothetical protein